MTDEPQQILITVQDFDTSISQLQHRKATLGERKELDALESQLAEVATRTAERQVERGALLERQAELEDQIGTLTARRRTIEDRMYADRSAAARDLQAMESEVRHLTQRRAEIEEAELEVMEEQEPIDAALAILVEDRAQLQATADVLRSEVVAAEAVVDAELASVIVARAAEAKRLPTELSDRYETLRARLGGTGAARLIGNHCAGCHLELPSVEVERLRRLPPAEVVTCDQCGRILVRS
jgi:hypothetical protein